MSDIAAKSNGWRLSENPPEVWNRCQSASNTGIGPGPETQSARVSRLLSSRSAGERLLPRTLSQARDRAGRARPDHPTSQPPGAGLLGRRRGRGRSAGSARPDLRVRRRGIMDHWSRGPKRRRHRLRARRNVRQSAAADPLLKFACMRRPGAIASRLDASRA